MKIRPEAASLLPSKARPFSASAAHAELDTFTPSAPKAIGSGVKEFFGSLGRKIGRAVERLTSLGGLVASVAPTVASLVVARELSRLEGVVYGTPPESAIDWLRTRTPRLYASNIKGLLKAASLPIEQALGLSLNDLLEVEKHFYTALAPVRGEDGFKNPPPFVRDLAEHPFRPPGTPLSAYVYLGEGREADSRYIMELWNSDTRPPENPFPEGDDRHHVWQYLKETVQDPTRLPIFVDLDGDATTFTGTEFVAKRTLASMVERNNNFGDGFRDTLYYSWLVTRLDSFYRSLEPWLAGKEPSLHERVGIIKNGLTPPWLGGKEGLGPWPSPGAVDNAHDEIARLGEKVNRDPDSAEGLCNFADVATALDRDLVTGVQTYWIKLLREVGAQRRPDALTPLQRAWIHLNIVAPDHPDYARVSPPDAPVLRALEGPPPRTTMKRYDRALALGEVVDHTLDGLSIVERRQFVKDIKRGVSTHTRELTARENRVRALVGESYEGLDVAAILREDFNRELANERLDQLRSAIDSGAFEGVDLSEMSRHWSMLDFLVNVDVRYGDVNLGLIPDSEAFRENPLAVGQFFQLPSDADRVTLLPRGPHKVETLGQAVDGDPLKLSLVFEGGGGKGFAYVECLKQFREILEAAPGRFAIDEYVGTSAGAITAGILAAGIGVDEMRGVLEQLDFKQFNSDAIWLMGGVDPKVRGINRAGLFSTQKMYQTIYRLLSEKLGVEGRPILFRDLPYKLKLVTVLLNTDLPENDPIRNLIDSDGRMVLSSEATPNFDVVAAIVASASVPAYFHPPQMEVGRPVAAADGRSELQPYRLQFADGGIVDNMSVSSAARDPDDSSLVVLPAHFRAVDPATGKEVGLDTLNFDTKNLAVIDLHNRELYRSFIPQLGEFLVNEGRRGSRRSVVAFNLSTSSQLGRPLVQGGTVEKTQELHRRADEVHLSHLPADVGRALINASLHPPSLGRSVGGLVFEKYIDGPAESDRDNFDYTWSDSRYRAGGGEEETVLDVGRAAGAAALASSKEEMRSRLFEKHPDWD